MKKLIVIISIIIYQSNFSQNQLHIGQYMVHQPFMNIACISEDKDINGAIFHKSQWTGIEGAPVIQGLNINFPLKNNKDFLGLSLVNDKIAINDLKELSAIYAHNLKTGKNSSLTMSLAGLLGFHKSDFTQIQVFSPNDPVFTSGIPTVVLPNFKFGTYFNWNKFNIGISIPTILQTNVIYTTQHEGNIQFNKNNIHIYIHSGYSFEINKDLDLKTSFLIKEVAGAPIQFDFNSQIDYKNKFSIGSSYRTSNELLAMASCTIAEDFILSYGYEMNFTDLGNHSSGTHEILLKFRIRDNNKIDMPLLNESIITD